MGEDMLKRRVWFIGLVLSVMLVLSSLGFVFKANGQVESANALSELGQLAAGIGEEGNAP